MISNLNVEKVLQVAEYGVPRHAGTSMNDLRANEFRDLDAPVFFLSTGRCGTKWITKLLQRDRKLKVCHSPTPSFGYQSKFIYDSIAANRLDLQAAIEIFLAGREQQLLYSFKADRRYIETNNRITFFAGALAELLPTARFVHVHRHPGEFVRSGIRRGWYTGKHWDDDSRIMPVDGRINGREWSAASHVQKIAWLWNETNDFIESFKKTVDPARIHTLRFSNIDADTVSAMLDQIGARVPTRRVKRLLDTPENVQTDGSFPVYGNWSDEQKRELIDICGELAGQYGYEL